MRSALWIAAAIACLAGALAIWAVDLPDETADDWSAAAARVGQRIRDSEIVLLHPPAHAARTSVLDGLPVACDTGRTGNELQALNPAGIWIVGDRGLTDKLKRLSRTFSNRSSARFGKVHVQHFWNPSGKRP
jgi:hypothetical protein